MADILGDIVAAVWPTSVEMLLWELTSFSASLMFFKELDLEIQGTDWFKGFEQDKSVKGILVYRGVKVLLDSLHHYWAGVALILYAPEIHLKWIGAGLLVADLPDFKRRFDDILKVIGDNLAGNTK